MSKASSVSTEAEQRKAAIEVSRERIRARWHRDGYRPDGHMDGLTCEGDIGVLQRQSHGELIQNARGGHVLTNWLAMQDLHQVIQHCHWIEHRRAVQASIRPAPEPPKENAA